MKSIHFTSKYNRNIEEKLNASAKVPRPGMQLHCYVISSHVFHILRMLKQPVEALLRRCGLPYHRRIHGWQWEPVLESVTLNLVVNVIVFVVNRFLNRAKFFNSLKFIEINVTKNVLET